MEGEGDQLVDEGTIRRRNKAGDKLTTLTSGLNQQHEPIIRKESTDEASKQNTEMSESDPDDEKPPDELYLEKLQVPKGGTDKTPELLTPVVHGLSDKWRNYVIRFIFTWLMIGAFCVIIYLGPYALMVITLAVQWKCFQEIINIGYSVYRVHGLPWFRSLSWYFLITSNYFFYGESLVDYSSVIVNRFEVFKWLINYHRFLSFSMYIIGFVWFVLSLVKKYYMRQFSLFAWTHVALLIVVTQSYLIIQNIFEGMIWFIVPVSMIVCNDVMAYMFGFFFGRTPLIKLSPKKTWEGFIGGGISTVLFGLIISYYLCQFPLFVCPTEYSDETNSTWSSFGLDCEPSYLFQIQIYKVPSSFGLSQIFGIPDTLNIYPFQLHSLSMSIFSSVIGPFGGFFASGFKRAFKIKDFGDIIPGHGGILDRFDCQFLMATFVNVYIASFIRTPLPQKLLQQVLTLKPEQQLQLYNALRDSLTNRGILQIIRG